MNSLLTYGNIQRYRRRSIIICQLSILIFNPVSALAGVCLTQSIEVTSVYESGGINQNDIETRFNGSTSYDSNPDTRFNHPNAIGDNAMALYFNDQLGAGNSFEIYYQIDDADGDEIEDYIDELTSHGFNGAYWDGNRNGLLDENDFDVNSDGDVDVGTGDYSPLGFVVWLFDGDPGDPVGSGSGTLVHTAYSPIQLLESVVYSFTIVAPAPFDHFVVESMPDGQGPRPALVEIELNGVANGFHGGDVGSSGLCQLSSDALL